MRTRLHRRPFFHGLLGTMLRRCVSHRELRGPVELTWAYVAPIRSCVLHMAVICLLAFAKSHISDWIRRNV